MVTFTVMGGSDANAPVRAAVPEVSVAAGGPVTEGAAASYTLTRTGATTDALTVTVSVTETAAMLATNPPTTVTFGPGQSNATLSVPTDDDAVEEPASTVTVGLVAGAGYTVASGSGSAEVTVEDNDAEELTAQFVGMPASHDGQTAFTFELHFSENVEGLSYLTLRDEAFAVTAGTVTRARRLSPPSNQRWEITVAPSSDADVVVLLPATGGCGGAGAICAGGRPLSNRLEATVAGPAAEAEVSIAAGSSPVTEGTAATYTLTRTGATTDVLTVTVGVTETQAMLAANPPSSVTFGAGDSSVTLTVATDNDAVVEPASVVTATVAAGSGYTVASGSGSAEVTVEDNDEAEAEPEVSIAAGGDVTEGAAATFTLTRTEPTTDVLTVTVSVTETEAMLAAGAPTSATFEANQSSVALSVATDDDTVPEPASEVTVTVVAGDDYTVAAGDGSAQVTVEDNDASQDTTLAGLTLSGIALGFVSDVESYTVLVDHDVTETTVTATPNDSGATVEIADADGSTAGDRADRGACRGGERNHGDRDSGGRRDDAYLHGDGPPRGGGRRAGRLPADGEPQCKGSLVGWHAAVGGGREAEAVRVPTCRRSKGSGPRHHGAGADDADGRMVGRHDHLGGRPDRRHGSRLRPGERRATGGSRHRGVGEQLADRHLVGRRDAVGRGVVRREVLCVRPGGRRSASGEGHLGAGV